MPASVTRLTPPSLPDAGAVGHSQLSIVEAGRLVFASGQVALRPDGEPAPSGLAEQVAIVAVNARAALDAIGATPQDIAIARIYLVDLAPERLGETMPQLLAAFDGAQPSITGMDVAALARPDLQVEMELVVRLPD